MEGMRDIRKRLIAYVLENSYMSSDADLELDDPEILVFFTRNNGDVEEGKPSKLDYLEARKVKRMLNQSAEFTQYVDSIEIDVINEWVLVNVILI